MATTLVNMGSTAEVAKELATHMVRVITAGGATEENKAEATAFIGRCKTAVQRADFLQFVEEIIALAPRVLNDTHRPEAEGTFSIVASMLNDAAVSTDITAQLAALLAAVEADTESSVALRLAVLGNTFNLMGKHAVNHRFEVFKHLVVYASKTGNLEQVRPYFGEVQSWVEDWSLEPAQTRDILSLISNVLEEAGETAEAQSYRVSYLATFDDAEGDLESVVPDAVRAIVAFVKTPEEVFGKKHLIDMAAVRQLEGHAQHGKLFKLLSIFATEKLDAYTAYAEANGEYMAGLGIDHAASLEAIRLLSLCSLAAESADGSITYATIAETLKIDEAESEQWVLSAIRAGLLTGRMDQLKSTVHVTGYKRRVFDRDAWLEVQSKLHAWHDSVSELLSTLRSRGPTRD